MTDQQSETVLEATALRKRYGALDALGGIDLTIRTGEVVALLGPNGTGKSTLVDLALGLSAPTSGTVALFGGSPRDAIVRGRVGAMLQGGALLPTLTVAQTVALVAAAHRHPLPVAEALRRARATDIAGRRISRLSGGETQRARFAVAVVSDPELLLLDEPTAAMDVEARHVFWAAMQDFAAQGRTVLFATHYLDEADTFADRIVVVNHGAVVADGTPAEIRAVATGRVVAFSSALPQDDDAWRAFPGVTAVIRRGERVSLTTDDSDATLRAVLAGHPDAHDLEVTSRTMDDAFLALTRDEAAGSTELTTTTTTETELSR